MLPTPSSQRRHGVLAASPGPRRSNCGWRSAVRPERHVLVRRHRVASGETIGTAIRARRPRDVTPPRPPGATAWCVNELDALLAPRGWQLMLLLAVAGLVRRAADAPAAAAAG